jgi:peptidyl-prolyl cis-trans isomerase B (cyclophilin B)
MAIPRVFIALAASLLLAATFTSQAQDKDKNPMVRMTTNYGTIEIEVLPEQAPLTAENFLRYVRDGFYDGVIFHRVVPNFVIQGGGMEPGMKEKETRPPIKNEADNGLKNDRGSLSMARTNEPDSASSQFFINLKDNEFLDHTAKTPRGWGYAVFAKVVSGMDVVDKIAKVPTTNSGFHQDVPTEDVVIEKAEVVE